MTLTKTKRVVTQKKKLCQDKPHTDSLISFSKYVLIAYHIPVAVALKIEQLICSFSPSRAHILLKVTDS